MLLKKYPYRTNMFTSGLLFGTGDCLAQFLFPHEDENGNKSKYDYYRTLRTVSYGSIFFAPIAVKWYSKTLPFLRNPFISLKNRSIWSSRRITTFDNAFRVGIDQLFFPGLIWIPMYNVVMSTLAMNEKPLEVAREKLEKNWWNILKTSWSVWPIFQIISFTFIPIHLRIVCSNVCSIGWNCFLSFVHNSKTHFDSKFLEEIHELDETTVNY